MFLQFIQVYLYGTLWYAPPSPLQAMYNDVFFSVTINFNSFSYFAKPDLIGYALTNLINDPSSLKLQSRDQNLI